MAFSNNPVYDRLIRNTGWPSLRLCLWLAFGLGLATLAFMSWLVLDTSAPMPFPLLGVILWLVAIFLTFLLPILVGIVAATITARDAQGEEYQLLRLTSVSPRTIVRGYMGAALHRLRLPLALMIGMMPALVIGMLWLGIVVNSVVAGALMECEMRPCGLTVSAETVNSLYWGSYAWLAAVMALWGVGLLAAALGGWLGLAWRKTAAAVTVTAFATLLMVIGVGVLLVILDGSSASPATTALIWLLLVPVPYLLGWGAAGLARSQAASERRIG